MLVSQLFFIKFRTALCKAKQDGYWPLEKLMTYPSQSILLLWSQSAPPPLPRKEMAFRSPESALSPSASYSPWGLQSHQFITYPIWACFSTLFSLQLIFSINILNDYGLSLLLQNKRQKRKLQSVPFNFPASQATQQVNWKESSNPSGSTLYLPVPHLLKSGKFPQHWPKLLSLWTLMDSLLPVDFSGLASSLLCNNK